jgi:2-polyprenyl-3-methyl-5-hydroxy-6-metoxy-1,4-benzoquinol methylase
VSAQSIGDGTRQEARRVGQSAGAAAVAQLADSWDVLVAAQRRLHDVRERTHRNFDGGDAGHQWDHSLVVRHAVNYAVAAHLLGSVSDPGALVDVGAGAGGFAVWAAHALERDLVVIDQDASHRELAGRAFPHVSVHAAMGAVAPAPAVLCMEVVEHVPYGAQARFVGDLGALVTPGGGLVMSTPDESGYWRGWSGYPPHIATLDGEGLGNLLHRALPGWAIEVMRIGGPGFELSRVGRYGVPVANRAWGVLESRAPNLTAELAYRLNQLSKRRSDPLPPRPGTFTVSAAASASGTGLVAWARRPR